MEEMLDIQKQYGDIAITPKEMSGMPFDQVMLFNPAHIEEVMRQEGKTPAGLVSLFVPTWKAYYQHKSLPESIGFLNGEEWRRVRTAFNQNFFAPTEAAEYLPTIADAVRVASQQLGKTKDFKDFMPKMMFEILTKLTTGKTLNLIGDNALKNTKEEKFVRDTLNSFEYNFEILAHPDEAKKFMEGKSEIYEKFVRSFDAVFEYGANLLTEMTAEYQNKIGQPGPKSYLPYLLARKDLSLEEVVSTFVFLLFAGVDTTQNTFQFLLCSLASKPDVQAKLYEELSRVLKGGDLTPETYNSLPYLRACVKENNRLHPVITGTARQITQPFRLGEHVIPVNALLNLQSSAQGFDETVFPNPHEYNPDRQLRSESGTSKANGFVNRMVPFGVGPRMCLGARVAEVELHALTARVIQDWSLSLPSNSPKWRMAAFRGVMEPHPMPDITFTKR